MDPALGRRWLSCASFAKDLFAHQQSVSGADWREWAASPEFLDPLRERMSLAGLSKAARDRLIERALADPGWFPIATLDASTRLVQSVVAGGGIRRGLDSMKLLAAVFQQTCENVDDIYAIIPQAYWSAAPDPDSAEYGELRLLLRGAVVLKLSARQAPTDPAHVSEPRSAMSPELAAALSEKPGHPMAQAWSLLKADGLLAPAALLGAMAIASGTTLIETLLFRGLFDLGALLNLPSQRLAAVAVMMAFVALALLIQIPIAAEALRFGRHLETRLRMALLDKLPRLTDRYFQSRPISDMADRSHSLHMIRQVPALGIQCFQSVFELLLALLGIALIDPASLPLAALVVVSAMAMPALLQPVLNERDLRVQSWRRAHVLPRCIAGLPVQPPRRTGGEPPARGFAGGVGSRRARPGARIDPWQRIPVAGLPGSGRDAARAAFPADRRRGRRRPAAYFLGPEAAGQGGRSDGPCASVSGAAQCPAAAARTLVGPRRRQPAHPPARGSGGRGRHAECGWRTGARHAHRDRGRPGRRRRTHHSSRAEPRHRTRRADRDRRRVGRRQVHAAGPAARLAPPGAGAPVRR
jgi:hypothetical protein